MAEAKRVHAAAAGSRSLASQLVKVDLATEITSRDIDTVPGEPVAIVEPTSADLLQFVLDRAGVPDLGDQSPRVGRVRRDAHVILVDVPVGPLGDGEHIDLNLDWLANRAVTWTLGVPVEAALHLQLCQSIPPIYSRCETYLLEGLGRQVNALANQFLGRHGLLLVTRLGGIKAHTAMERTGIALARRGTSTGARVALLRTRGSAAGAGSALAAARAVGRTVHAHAGHPVESRVAGLVVLVRRHLDQNAVSACCVICVLVSKGSPRRLVGSSRQVGSLMVKRSEARIVVGKGREEEGEIVRGQERTESGLIWICRICRGKGWRWGRGCCVPRECYDRNGKEGKRDGKGRENERMFVWEGGGCKPDTYCLVQTNGRVM